MMCQMQKELSRSYRAELVDCIDSARKGQLPPSQQEFCFEEIESLKGTDEYPEDGDALFRQLRMALACRPQISEEEHEAEDVNSFGGKLLFFFYLDRYTLMELAEQPTGTGYYSFAFISSGKHDGKLEQTAARMKAALDSWLEHTSLSPSAITAADKPNGTDFCHCDTLAEAVSFLYTALKFPDTILT